MRFFETRGQKKALLKRPTMWQTGRGKERAMVFGVKPKIKYGLRGIGQMKK